MYDMYECGPSQKEQNVQLLEVLMDDAHGAGASFVELATKLVQMVRGAPALPPEPIRGWTEVIVDIGFNFMYCYMWLYAILHVCATWHETLKVTLPPNVLQAREAFGKRPGCKWDAPALICLFVVTRWHGMQNMGILLLFVGIMSMQLATVLPMMSFFNRGVFGETEECWEQWTTKRHYPTSEFCDNRIVTLKTFATFFYFLIVRCIIVASLLDIMMMLVVRVRNFKISNPRDIQLHTPYCFYMCAVYELTNRLHSRYMPYAVIHKINMLVFAACGIKTFLPRFKEHISQKSSMP